MKQSNTIPWNAPELDRRAILTAVSGAYGKPPRAAARAVAFSIVGQSPETIGLAIDEIRARCERRELDVDIPGIRRTLDEFAEMRRQRMRDSRPRRLLVVGPAPRSSRGQA